MLTRRKIRPPGQKNPSQNPSQPPEKSAVIPLSWDARPTIVEEKRISLSFLLCNEGKSAINLSNLGNFCQIWPRVIYLC